MDSKAWWLGQLVGHLDQAADQDPQRVEVHFAESEQGDRMLLLARASPSGEGWGLRVRVACRSGAGVEQVKALALHVC